MRRGFVGVDGFGEDGAVFLGRSVEPAGDPGLVVAWGEQIEFAGAVFVEGHLSHT